MSEFRVDDQLCFALYDASRAIVGRYRLGLETVGLTYTQYLVLLRLWERSPQPLADIGEALNLDSGTLSPLTRRLDAQGLVTRRRVPSDERTVELALTEVGFSLEPAVRAIQAEVERATGLDEATLDGLRDSLHGLASRLRDEAPAGPA